MCEVLHEIDLFFLGGGVSFNFPEIKVIMSLNRPNPFTHDHLHDRIGQTCVTAAFMLRWIKTWRARVCAHTHRHGYRQRSCEEQKLPLLQAMVESDRPENRPCLHSEVDTVRSLFRRKESYTVQHCKNKIHMKYTGCIAGHILWVHRRAHEMEKGIFTVGIEIGR